jgi:hypothetical protein
MPAYNFQPQFVEMILNGSKPHTIRMPRKNPTEAGDWIYMYTGLRTKQAKKFAESIIVAVTPIIIYSYSGFIRKDGVLFENDEVIALARNDGFPSPREFFDFFIATYKESTLNLELIEWDTDRLVRC